MAFHKRPRPKKKTKKEQEAEDKCSDYIFRYGRKYYGKKLGDLPANYLRHIQHLLSNQRLNVRDAYLLHQAVKVELRKQEAKEYEQRRVRWKREEQERKARVVLRQIEPC